MTWGKYSKKQKEWLDKPRCGAKKIDPIEPDHNHTCKVSEGHATVHKCACNRTWVKENDEQANDSIRAVAEATSFSA